MIAGDGTSTMHFSQHDGDATTIGNIDKAIERWNILPKAYHVRSGIRRLPKAPPIMPTRKREDKVPNMKLLDPRYENVTRKPDQADKEELWCVYGYGYHTAMKTCMVAELLRDKHILASGEARKAANKEWLNLETRGCGNLTRVAR